MRRMLGPLVALVALAGCGGHAATAACSSSDYRVSVGAQGATGSLVGMTGVVGHPSFPCRLNERLTFAIQEKVAGTWKTIQPMTGNPAHAQLVGLLKRGTHIGHDWAWWNYCGLHGRFRFLATSGGHSAAHQVTPPHCNSNGTGPGGIGPFPPEPH